jgi:enoyl-CoA hydratase
VLSAAPRLRAMTGRQWWDQTFEDLQVTSRESSGRRVAVVTLDLPERRNSMSAAMTASWVDLLGPAFCAGGDLSWIVSEPDATVPELRARMLAFYRSWLSVRDLEVPIIAAVNGSAIGAGFAIALACDLRYAAADARLGVPFTSLGLHPGMATTWSLPDVAGQAVARDLLLTGRVISGQEAVGLGLVSRAVPAEEVLDEALAAADRIAAAAPVATRLTLQALRGGGHADLEAALQWEALAQATTLATQDVHEGIAAAAGRRTPRFRGR